MKNKDDEVRNAFKAFWAIRYQNEQKIDWGVLKALCDIPSIDLLPEDEQKMLADAINTFKPWLSKKMDVRDWQDLINAGDSICQRYVKHTHEFFPVVAAITNHIDKNQSQNNC